jgi:hypothetical protein
LWLFPFKAYGEVSPEFVQRFGDKLSTRWHLWDDHGIQHKLTFNMKYLVPHLTDGWFALAQHLRVQQPSELHFFYYGGKVFRISIKRVVTNTQLYPSFHSLSTKPNFTTFFHLKLTKYTATASQLVNNEHHISKIIHIKLYFLVVLNIFTFFTCFQTLQKDFAKYLQDKAIKKVVLCNEAIDLVECSVLVRGPPKNSVKIGSGWKYFCSILRYQPGDVLRFKLLEDLLQT